MACAGFSLLYGRIAVFASSPSAAARSRTVSSQIERLQLREPQMTLSFWRNVPTQLSDDLVCGKIVLKWRQFLKYCVNGSLRCQNHIKVAHECTKISFIAGIYFFLLSFQLQVFVFNTSCVKIFTTLFFCFVTLSHRKTVFSNHWMYLQWD